MELQNLTLLTVLLLALLMFAVVVIIIISVKYTKEKKDENELLKANEELENKVDDLLDKLHDYSSSVKSSDFISYLVYFLYGYQGKISKNEERLAKIVLRKFMSLSLSSDIPNLVKNKTDVNKVIEAFKNSKGIGQKTSVFFEKAYKDFLTWSSKDV